MEQETGQSIRLMAIIIACAIIVGLVFALVNASSNESEKFNDELAEDIRLESLKKYTKFDDSKVSGQDILSLIEREMTEENISVVINHEGYVYCYISGAIVYDSFDVIMSKSQCVAPGLIAGSLVATDLTLFKDKYNKGYVPLNEMYHSKILFDYGNAESIIYLVKQ